MKILITGASGMVGRNILDDARFAQFEILSPKRAELNLFNYKDVFSYLEKNRPDVIVHAAGRVGGIQANLAHPVDFLVENLDINRNVILAAYHAKIKNLVNLGSSCMYPREAQNPLKEELILKGELEPTNEGYAIAKITAQRLCSYIRKEDSSFKFKTLIPCNLYGKFDKFDPVHSHLVPAIIRKLDQAIKSKQSEVEIWGDGTARREFMYCGDVVNCIYQAIDSDMKNFDSMPDLMNIGLGYDYSVNEYYQTTAKILGYKGQFVYDRTKPVGMKQKLVSVEKAQEWGWKSQVSLEQGLAKAIQFFHENI